MNTQGIEYVLRYNNLKYRVINPVIPFLGVNIELYYNNRTLYRLLTISIARIEQLYKQLIFSFQSGYY
jgi:hypothetical protein